MGRKVNDVCVCMKNAFVYVYVYVFVVDRWRGGRDGEENDKMRDLRWTVSGLSTNISFFKRSVRFT